MPTKLELEKALKKLNKENEQLRETIDTLSDSVSRIISSRSVSIGNRASELRQADGLANDGAAEYVDRLRSSGRAVASGEINEFLGTVRLEFTLFPSSG